MQRVRRSHERHRMQFWFSMFQRLPCGVPDKKGNEDRRKKQDSQAKED